MADPKPTGEPGGESVVSAEAQAVVDEWAAGPSTTFARLVSLISSALEAAREEGRQEARFDHLHGLARGTNVLLEMVKAKAREEERERCAKQLCSGCNASAPQERPGWNGLWHFVERDLWSTCAAASFLARPTPKAPEGGPTKCANCGFSPGAHADGYCPNCVGGTRYVPRVADALSQVREAVERAEKASGLCEKHKANAGRVLTGCWGCSREEETAALRKAEKERDEARRFGEDAAKRYNDLLTEGRVLRCAFCSATYPPDTPPTQHEALTAHVLVCPTHPMRNVEADLATARAQVREELEGLALKMCQTCAGGHQGWDKIATRAPRDWHYGYAGQWSHHQHGEIDEWYRIACAAAVIHDRLRVLSGGQP